MHSSVGTAEVSTAVDVRIKSNGFVSSTGDGHTFGNADGSSVLSATTLGLTSLESFVLVAGSAAAAY